MHDYYVIKALAPSLGVTPRAEVSAELLPEAGLSSSRSETSPPGVGRAAEFFSDDVVVDFPSLERAIARIRVGFELAEIERQIT